jgi:transcriptional regulator with XRE-family HTH domain
MSSGKSSAHRKPDTARSPRLPHFADKLRKILEYFPITEGEIAQKTGASQQSVSDWLLGKTCPRDSTLMTLSTRLPEPIPLWWLTAGPEAGSLKEALRKEKQQQEIPEPTERQVAQEFAREVLSVLQKFMSREDILELVGEKNPKDEG